MNLAQRIAIIAGFVLIALAGLFPPWVYTVRASNEVKIVKPAPRGYPLFLAPQPERDHPLFGVQVDFARLAVEWVVVAAVTGGAVAALHLVRRPQRSASTTWRSEASVERSIRDETGTDVGVAAVTSVAGTQAANSPVLTRHRQPVGAEEMEDLVMCPACGRPNRAGIPRCVDCQVVLRPTNLGILTAVILILNVPATLIYACAGYVYAIKNSDAVFLLFMSVATAAQVGFLVLVWLVRQGRYWGRIGFQLWLFAYGCFTVIVWIIAPSLVIHLLAGLAFPLGVLLLLQTERCKRFCSAGRP